MDIEKAINDSISRDMQPPEMAHVSLGDPRYQHLPRTPTTLVSKRKSVDLYKGCLRTHGDVAPLTVASFTSIHAARRCGLEMLRTMAPRLQWGVRALGIPHAFSQSGNLRPEDRLVVRPPPMVTIPWTGKFPPPKTDAMSLPPPRHGFLLLRPFYGGRDATMRRWLTASKRLRSRGYRQPK